MQKPNSDSKKNQDSIPKKGRALTYLILVIVSMMGLLSFNSFSIGEYSPAPAMIFQGERITVTGRIMFENGTPAAYVDVRIFATDELISETVKTDELGYFYSTMKFEAGQILTISISGFEIIARFEYFIQYDLERESFNEFGGSDYLDFGVLIIDSP